MISRIRVPSNEMLLDVSSWISLRVLWLSCWHLPFTSW